MTTPLKKILHIIFWLCAQALLFVVAAEESSRTLEQATEQVRQSFYQCLSNVPEDKIPMELHSRVRSMPDQKCNTIYIGNVRQNIHLLGTQEQRLFQTLFARPVLPNSVVSPSSEFRIHYATLGRDAVPPQDTDNNGIPDFVDEAARAYDNSMNLLLGRLRYKKQPSDGGVDGPEYDVYIIDLGSGYGETTVDERAAGNSWTSFIKMDNDFDDGHFTTGVDAIRVTAAHEYYHALQIGYRIWAGDEAFYYELCSTWMEDVVYDDVNDYYQYLPFYYSHRDISFNEFQNPFHYGQGIWSFYLEKFFDPNTAKSERKSDVIRRSWEVMADGIAAIPSINTALQERGSSFNERFAEFPIWNYFTASRANPSEYYDEGPAYPEMQFRADEAFSESISVSDSLRALTYQYYRFSNLTQGGYFINPAVPDNREWRFAAIITPDGGSASTHVFDAQQGLRIRDVLPASSEIIVMPVNNKWDESGDVDDNYYQFTINIEQVREVEVYPNPYIASRHDEVRFLFTESENEELVIRILTSEGRPVKIAKLSDGSDTLTSTSYVWDGLDDSNNPVASGIYMIHIVQGKTSDLKKFAVIR
jgi:hypothetical protein